MVSIKLVIISAIVFVLLIAGGIIIFFPKNINVSSSIISESELFSGINVSMGEKEMIKFELDETEHNLSVDSISENYINITLQSAVIKTRINVGQIRRFDLDEDEKEDLILLLNNISEGKVDLSLKKMCFENWTCSDWSSCSENNQTRTCADANSCGTAASKPEETRECLLNCSDLKGFLCDATEICNGTIKNSVQGNCCIGKCKIKELEFINCGADIDCFISASETCNPSNFTKSSVLKNTTWEQTAVSYYKIRELESDKCKLYKEILSNDGSFTASERQRLTNEGNTEDDINFLENEISNSIVGKAGICQFSVYALKERLIELKNGNDFITTDELENYECSGDIVWVN